VREKSKILAEIGRHSLLDVVPGLSELILEKGETRLLRAGRSFAGRARKWSTLFMPISARIRLMVSSGGAGNESLIGHLQKNHALGLRELFEARPYAYSAVAEGPTMVLFLPKEEFLSLTRARPEVQHYLRLMTSSSGVRNFKLFLEERKIDRQDLFSVLASIHLEPVVLKSSQQLDLSDPSLWFVGSGHLRVTSLPGRPQEFSTHVGEGAWLGGEALVAPFKLSYEVLALQDTRLQRAPLKKLGPILDRLGLTEAIFEERWLDRTNIGSESMSGGVLTRLAGRPATEEEITGLGFRSIFADSNTPPPTRRALSRLFPGSPTISGYRSTYPVFSPSFSSARRLRGSGWPKLSSLSVSTSRD